jgi:excisionase family DNA binding protein
MLTSNEKEFTTQEAAVMLNVSRPFVIKQIENGTLPSKKVGTELRIEFRDLMQYKVKIQQQTGKALDDLSTLSQEMGLEY